MRNTQSNKNRQKGGKTKATEGSKNNGNITNFDIAIALFGAIHGTHLVQITRCPPIDSSPMVFEITRKIATDRKMLTLD